MTENIPDYTAVKLPDDKPPAEFTTHERRANILRFIFAAGDPGAIKQVQLAERHDVHESTISRDLDRIRESVTEHLGDEAVFETVVDAKHTIEKLREQGRYYKAWQVRTDLNELLFDTGRLDREPRRSELDVDVDSRHAEVAYTVVREGEDAPLPTTDDGVDYSDLGFTSGPVAVDVDAEGEGEGAERDE